LANELKLVIAIVFACLLSGNVQSEVTAPGIHEVAVSSPVRASSVRALVWYPTPSTDKPVSHGASGVFVGSSARPGAAVALGKHPLVLVSHGGFRSAANSANWLASAMTEQGYIAAVVTPPAIRPGPARAKVLNELSFRPLDLSSTISALETDDTFRDRIDFDRIAVVGFYLGGYSALALAGVELDAELLAGSCAQENRSLDCEWFNSGSVDLRALDLRKIARPKLPVRDRRVRAVVSVDPEWIHSVSEQGFKQLSASIHFINVGPWGLADSVLNAAGIAKAIPGAGYTKILEAGSFSTFGECTLKGPAILKEAGEDARLCQDGDANKPRAEIHGHLVKVVMKVLSAALGR